MAHAKNPALEACRSLFGEHPEDVISPINGASAALYWIEEIFKTISREALNASAGYRIKHLSCPCLALKKRRHDRLMNRSRLRHGAGGDQTKRNNHDPLMRCHCRSPARNIHWGF